MNPFIQLRRVCPPPFFSLDAISGKYRSNWPIRSYSGRVSLVVSVISHVRGNLSIGPRFLTRGFIRQYVSSDAMPDQYFIVCKFQWIWVNTPRPMYVVLRSVWIL